MLYILAMSAGHVVAKEAIYDYVFPNKARRAHDTSVEECVHAVRRKLAAADPSWTYIHTHHRVGYRLDPEPIADPS
jgi:DNA-binding winged helix-turn-helix (wHTH) protein